MFDTYGSDAMRWCLMSSPILRGGDLVVTEQGIRDTVRQVLLPLWNVWYFFTLYANAEAYQAARRIDRARARPLHPGQDAGGGDRDRGTAGRLRRRRCLPGVRAFLDVLTNWYVRRSRDRFWAGDPDAFDTLYTVLETPAGSRRRCCR